MVGTDGLDGAYKRDLKQFRAARWFRLERAAEDRCARRHTASITTMCRRIC